MKEKYTESSVIYQLNKKNDLDVSQSHKIIRQLSSGKGDVGIKSKGKIDFLIKYCGYTHMYVTDF